ncbi:hypothetical protein [Xanthomonas arboricola]|uniref:hypothetical protein n=1 Tax=Xanthomonas arboricola TaxID=56448 RepID=UPI000F8D79E5|nr:hypothetical protein [Xanthomonas arboricola]
MSFKIIAQTKDIRTGTTVLYAQSSIGNYLSLVGSEFDEFEIQRKRVQHKAYGRMKEDIKAGTLLPTITLAVKKDFIADISRALSDPDQLENLLQTPGKVNILDGLQRTHILSDIKTEGHVFPDNQKVILEFWLEGDVKNLIYRIIVLNSGQKPMSMRHQIELLFSTTKENLKDRIPGLDIITERDEARRTRPEKFPLERLALSYYSFITKSTEIDKENIIAQKLVEDSVLEGGEQELGAKFDKYTKFLDLFSKLDREIHRVYSAEEFTWFGSENFMVSFFAAVADFSITEEREARVNQALAVLLSGLQGVQVNTDLLGYQSYKAAIQGVSSRKTNVGYATRKLLFSVLKEYFREEGEKPIAELWAIEA